MGHGMQEAFDKIKRYLENPSVLVPATPGRPLIVYLTVLEESMGCMLGQQDTIGKKEQAIYYINLSHSCLGRQKTQAIHAVRGEWEIRDPKLVQYHNHVREIMTTFDAVTFCHVPCKENQTADALATLSAMMAYYQCLTNGTVEPNTEPWYFDIKRYLEKGEYPNGASKNSKRTLRCLASGFLLSGVILYKRNTDMTPLMHG
ncbi:hypothetical protein CR513_16405, partial [Mucuna pruriens]